jgi:pyruvate dehydrogenase E1 component alpha subunit
VDLYKRGASHNIPGEAVDGMDVEAVYAAGLKAVEWARSGKGPIILEMKTYRYRGHSMSDPAKYRTREEVLQVREKHDPIDTFGSRLVQRGVLREDELKSVDKEVRDIINRASEFATESPEPAPEELYTDVYK